MVPIPGPNPSDGANVVIESLPQRDISEEFMRQFESGILRPILERLQHDDTLSLEIRNGYVNIYYRGGNLLRLVAKKAASCFEAFFDERYCGDDGDYGCLLPAERPPAVIVNADDARAWVDAFSHYKQAMDIRFVKHPKIEREYQQAVVRDNNRHSSGDKSDYLIVDIEYTQAQGAFPGRSTNFRFDMVGLRWPAEGKTRASGLVTPVIMEMKTGDAALSSTSSAGDGVLSKAGLVKHVRDIEAFLDPAPGEEASGQYELLCRELLRSFEVKQRLGLPSVPKRMRNLKITGTSPRPEILFVIANHQTSSTVLARELRALPRMDLADYKMATVEWMGYALFEKNMRPLDEFIRELEAES
jgi:hypothetical protein